MVTRPLLSQDAVALMTPMESRRLDTRVVVQLRILDRIFPLLDVSGHGGAHNCHHSTIPISGPIVDRKYLGSAAQWVNVLKEVVDDLIVASRAAVLSSTDSLQLVNGCYAMPRLLVQGMVEVIDACIEGIPYVPMDDANLQSRGLGSMVAFWERMRNICPKVNLYHGPIYGKDGDEAMLATRDFWFQAPEESDHAWQPVLDCYAAGDPSPLMHPPDPDVFLGTLLHTKDSAPGPDGLPYSAWRLLPHVTADVMYNYFYDIVNGTALPSMQVGVWIPKAKMGPEADNFRPLGMPNTLDRLVDGSVAAHVMKKTAHLMHPSQAVMS